ncbi:SDR family NAD(P)-dependent oxidoreductase [Oceanicaulis sp. LC35]|uniref:SDR family NAD(P)-dependent oxidoreductase n=1 Tax=Oceanicaulis sp. LC35 TaxID=3349635 RepID=UPI003F848AFA
MSEAVLITGGSSGIGLALSELWLKRGYELLWVSLDEAEIERARAGLLERYPHTRIKGMALDLAAPDSVQRIVDWSTSEGGVEVLVNNAGFGVYGESKDIPLAAEQAMIDVNLRALHALTRAFLPILEARDGGYIINLASNSAFVPTPGLAVYAATKAFVRHYSLALEQELSRSGSRVRVMTVCPSAISDTPFKERAGMGGVRTFESFAATTAAEVAADIIKGYDRDATEVVTGAAMRRTLILMRFAPASLVRWLTRRETQKT